MKDKTRATAMICTTAADGTRLPIAIILGKTKKPSCFQLLDPRAGPPLPYKEQENPCFDKSITLWWINSVLLFWPAKHLRKHGDVNAILILDSAHNIGPGSLHDSLSSSYHQISLGDTNHLI